MFVCVCCLRAPHDVVARDGGGGDVGDVGGAVGALVPRKPCACANFTTTAATVCVCVCVQCLSSGDGGSRCVQSSRELCCAQRIPSA